jgi:hypothetical protein
MRALFGRQEIGDVDYQRRFREEVDCVWRVFAAVVHQWGLLSAASNIARKEREYEDGEIF